MELGVLPIVGWIVVLGDYSFITSISLPVTACLPELDVLLVNTHNMLLFISIGH